MVAMTDTEDGEESWLFTSAQLEYTASRDHGISVDEEKRLRSEGANFIHEVGKKLRMPRLTLATGCVLFHRFYMYRSFKDFQNFDIAACTLFLAGKVEETPKKVRDVVITCYQERTGVLLDENSREYAERRDDLLRLECVLLQTVSFDLTIEHPYEYLLGYVKALKGDKSLAQYAWNFLNDSIYATTLCLQYPPQVVACAVLQYAAYIANRPIPGGTDGSEWWQYRFHVKSSRDEMQDIGRQLRAVYDDATYEALKQEVRASLASSKSTDTRRSSDKELHDKDRARKHS